MRCTSFARTTRTARRSCSKAQAEGISPQQLVARIAVGTPASTCRAFTSASTTGIRRDSPENTELSQDIYRRLKAAGLIYSKAVEQFFDPVKGMFLADRYIKGECPNCHSKDQYGDACEVCSTVYAPTDLIEPLLDSFGRPAGAEDLRTSLLPAFRSRNASVSESMDRRAGSIASRRWRTRRGNGSTGAATRRLATGISRATRPTSAFRFPDSPGKYFYVWLDAPIGYLACAQATTSIPARLRHVGELRSFNEFLAANDTEQIHFIGKDIIYFHTLFWPAMLKFAGSPYRVPDHVYVHGFITVSGEKMSKSRGTGTQPAAIPGARHEPGVAALLHRGQAQRQCRGPRFQRR